MTRNTASPVHEGLKEGSRFGQRIRRRYANDMDALPEGLPDTTSFGRCFAALQKKQLSAADALRVTRHLVLERLLCLECESATPLADVTGTMTALAQWALQTACAEAMAQLCSVHGSPRSAGGDTAQLCVIGMGKLGAHELNVSSDIDLIYVYDHDGDTTGGPTGRGSISNQEFFGKVVRMVSGLIGEATEHGIVFRVDLALRPNGNSGPPAVSLGALEEYFHVQGREWERFAWLKSRIVAPAGAMQSACAQSLRSIVVPFVFRRYLDYNVFESLRILHRQIRDHATKRSAGRPERSNDVKLSRGGIREIEFTVQLLQVVRGGQYPELRTRPTVSALQRLSAAGLMSTATADALAQAYVFLRQVEHRIQYLDDQQTHVLPTTDADLDWIAHTMHFADSCAFLAALDAHRELVAQEFDALLGGNTTSCKGGGCKMGGAEIVDFDGLLERLQGDFRTRVAGWRNHPKVMALKETSRQRLGRLVLCTGLWLAEGRVTETAALRLLDWMEPLMRRESYLALLLERPAIHERLLRILGAAQWPTRYLLQHPGVIDELASSQLLNERFDPAAFAQDLERRHAALAQENEADDEAVLNLLRRAHHAEVFRILVRDIEGRLSVEQVADDLSALADCVLRVTTAWCWQRLKTRHRENPLFAILAYGKLGGKELGYGSDLDIVFVYDDPDERASEVYAALVRKLINWLTIKTGEGDLYAIDTALRPNGNSGLLVTSFEAYANYQLQRGSNTAWTWEHQAMTRARCVLGDAAMHTRFEAIRQAVLAAPRDAKALRQEIATMRDKLRAAHPRRANTFDVKYSPGGMVDVEFAVQYLVLLHSAKHPELRPNVGNIALLQRAQACGLLPGQVGDAAARAYRALRQIQHQARLNEEAAVINDTADAHATQAPQTAVLALWDTVFTHPAHESSPTSA